MAKTTVETETKILIFNEFTNLSLIHISVKVNTDSENPQVVANLTEEKKELLRGVFWDMNTISHQIGRETITEIVVQTDEKGNAVEKEQTVEKTVLTVSVTHKPAEEMAARYFFNPSQKAAITELLAPEFDTLWTGVLSGMISDGGDLVAERCIRDRTRTRGCITSAWKNTTRRKPSLPLPSF